MARTSRISRRAGSLFVQLYHDDVRVLGRAGAAVLSSMEWLDRVEEEPGRFVGTRARLVAHLQGVVGKNAVFAAVDQLVRLGILKERSATRINQAAGNLTTWQEYALDAGRASDVLTGNTEPGNPEMPESVFPEMPESEPISEPEPGFSPSNNKKTEIAAAEKGAQRRAAACASVHKEWKRRPSGIVTWDARDEANAARLEAEHAPEKVRAAVQELESAKKEPMPNRVERALAGYGQSRLVEPSSFDSEESRRKTLEIVQKYGARITGMKRYEQ